MARKKDTEIVHPLTAIDALSGYHSDVGYLLTAVQSAASMLSNKDLDARKVADSVAPHLEEAVKRVRRWYEGNQ